MNIELNETVLCIVISAMNKGHRTLFEEFSKATLRVITQNTAEVAYTEGGILGQHSAVLCGF